MGVAISTGAARRSLRRAAPVVVATQIHADENQVQAPKIPISLDLE